MDDKIIDLSSQDLCEIPDFVFISPQIQKLVLDFNDILVLPSILCQKLSRLCYLSLNGNMLETLPIDINSFKELSELYLKENSLYSLPDSLSELSKLVKLHLTGNQMKEFPRNFGNLCSLYELIADENEIVHLPNTFGNLCNLTLLDLSNNSLQALPDSFGSLKSLKELDLCNNNLKCLPDSFRELPKLEILDLTNNEIKQLPDELLSSRSLKKILMNENSLTGLPGWLSIAENLEEMCFAANDLLDVPIRENFGIHNNNLVLVNLSGNNITDIPENFGKLKKLQYLDLGSSFDELERNRFIANGNNLKYLPDSFANLQNLVKLELDENEILELPSNFGHLVNLTYLDLCHNNLKTLPDSFCMLNNMKVCMLSMNYLAELPTQFGTLSAVEDLKLDNNLLTELPDSFKHLTTLTALDLYNNNLKEIPSVLSELKKLKHLDLRENDFGIPIEEIPDINCEPTYLKRKDEFSDTWRGRKRPDINSTSWVESKNETQKKDLNDDVIYSALTQASSLWRKHGQSNVRQKSPKKVGNNEMSVPEKVSEIHLNKSTHPESVVSEESGNQEQSSEGLPESSCNELNGLPAESSEEECWDEDFYEEFRNANENGELDDCNSGTISQHSSESSSSIEPEEKFVELSDWENDSVDIPNNFNKIYRYSSGDDKSNINVLIPSDMHANLIKRPELWQPSEEGQFDDADL